jgi:hypothetical protein
MRLRIETARRRNDAKAQARRAVGGDVVTKCGGLNHPPAGGFEPHLSGEMAELHFENRRCGYINGGFVLILNTFACLLWPIY